MSDFPSDYEEFIYKSRYARWLDGPKRRERLSETIDRYFDFMATTVKIADPVRHALSKMIADFKIVPSMRALMTSGPALHRDNVASFNCAFLPVDDPIAFDEAMYILLCGTGVGFSVEIQFISKLPVIPADFELCDEVIKVQDSKEGWALAGRALIASLFKGLLPRWDVSQVRPKGARLKTFGGRASGPEPLVELFQFLCDIFIEAAGRQLTDLECHDIMCKIAQVIIVGGVRRSALISLTDLDSEAMANAKSGEWWVNAPHRSLANISAVYEGTPDGVTFGKEWQALIDSKSGERGIFNRAAARAQVAVSGRRDPDHMWGTNPCCVSADTSILTRTGNVPIKDVVSKSVEIWNGTDWAFVVPYEAGLGYIWRVTLSDGSFLDCTPNHRFVIKGGALIEIQDLFPGVVLEQFPIPGKDLNVNLLSIQSIQGLDRHEMTYCFTEPKTSRGTFNGIVTGNSEIILRPYQFCNLSSAIIRAEDTLDDVLEKVQGATILGTYQATLTNFPYLRDIWRQNTEEERLLGVSLTGVMDHPILSGGPQLPYWLETMREKVVETNKEWADIFGIAQATATTCVKPEGTVSQYANTGSGMHARYSKFYIRRVRQSNHDPITALLKSYDVPNEPDTYSKDTTVFAFLVKAPQDCMTRHSLLAIEQLEMWKIYQRHWCEHKPSITVYVGEDEWAPVGRWVLENFAVLSGVAFLPKMDDDHSYAQAPYEEISEQQYVERLSKMPPKIDWDGLSMFEFDDETLGAQTLACVAGNCEIN